MVEPASKLQQTGRSSRRSLDFNVATGNQAEGALEHKNYSTLALQVSIFCLCVLAEYSALLMSMINNMNNAFMDLYRQILYSINDGFIQGARFCDKKN